jgi:ferrous iron transport protein A
MAVSPLPDSPLLELPTLADLPSGSSATVERVESGPLGTRLEDLGFVPGSRVEVLRRAPLGDPILFLVRGTRLCLRRTEARSIRVKPEGAPARGAR